MLKPNSTNTADSSDSRPGWSVPLISNTVFSVATFCCSRPLQLPTSLSPLLLVAQSSCIINKRDTMTCWMWSMRVSSVSFLPASSVTWNTAFFNKDKDPHGMDQNGTINKAKNGLKRETH
ncbi:hypothetical protein CR513_22968, partial [Mucuna pruriens]